jgi:hypothetical protein
LVNKRHGINLPIMTLQERTLSVLGCKVITIFAYTKYYFLKC